MHVALIGATGQVGSRVLDELLSRGHRVTGIVRGVEHLPIRPGLTRRRGDVMDQPGLVGLLSGHDAVVSAVKFKDCDTQQLIDSVEAAGTRRYIVVGGAGSLEVAPGVRVMDTPGFPTHVRPEALLGGEFLDQLRASRLDWTFFSPSLFLVPGERTGEFRYGKDQLMTTADGSKPASISLEDYAMALVDELESPLHLRQRFTVGY
ncbi:NAD(P)-dependent oxidoreductase [Dyella sp. C9]|uniref:NAD(P)-dependent oxidoreductase n=1 Tax=Dyella sp. C9 TaxID=2202154 RepID=UPI000DF01D7D|nr:NAD(P)-dependent oxidoreductase [Dyella sp. C9]